MKSEREKATTRARQERYRREGRCIGCGSVDERTERGKCYCQVCHARQIKCQVQRQESRRSMELCILCGKPARDEGVLCVDCARRNTENAAVRYAELRRKGLCVTCGKNPARPGRIRCEACAEKQREMNRKNG